jgi:hypothetical protein
MPSPGIVAIEYVFITENHSLIMYIFSWFGMNTQLNNKILKMSWILEQRPRLNIKISKLNIRNINDGS